MFINNFTKEQKEKYFKYIKCVGSLSGLFSESKIPFLHYRAAENIFCKSFRVENLSRADIAYDAKWGSTGIGLKTFVSHNNKSREKIAEFNTHSQSLQKFKGIDLAKKLLYLVNNRIEFANRTYGINEGVYHCLSRQENMIKIFETAYNLINENSIKVLKKTDSSLFFEQGNNEYSYNFSKSTLYRKFYIPDDAITLPIQIINDPYELILRIFDDYVEEQRELENVILPLYSTRNAKEKIVPQRSGLNQWNARGRKRDLGEVYIPVPRKIHELYPNFFPPKDRVFKLILPNQEQLCCKICQEGGKALMSNPNKALSKWLLRIVLNIKEGELLTYEHLRKIGIDSVKVTKTDRETFKIDFVKIGSYEKFDLKMKS